MVGSTKLSVGDEVRLQDNEVFFIAKHELRWKSADAFQAEQKEQADAADATFTLDVSQKSTSNVAFRLTSFFNFVCRERKKRVRSS
jgi:hypothetical protein